MKKCKLRLDGLSHHFFLPAFPLVLLLVFLYPGLAATGGILAAAHRLSTLRNVDRVLVIERGRIVKDGSIPELLALPEGHSAHLHALQSGALNL